MQHGGRVPALGLGSFFSASTKGNAGVRCIFVNMENPSILKMSERRVTKFGIALRSGIFL